MDALIARLLHLVQRKDRFTFDLRGNCHVYAGVVAAYRTGDDSGHFTDLAQAVAHALAHDGIIGAWRDASGNTVYDSCRLFTDLDSAIRFARREGQRAVYNLNRDQEVPVGSPSAAA